MRLFKNGESKSGKAPEVKGIKRGEAPLRNILPLPLSREGGQGDRLK